MHSRWRLVLALLAGLVHTAAFAPTGLWWLQILALAGLVRLARDATPGQAAALGAFFGVGWLASGMWWLYISMHDFGNIPALAAALAVLLLAIFLSSYYAAALALTAWIGRVFGRSLGHFRIAVFTAAWLLAELARATFFSGFPWGASGYAHSVGPLAVWAPWIGVYGIAALAAACAAALASAPSKSLTAMVLIVAAGALLPQNLTTSTGTLRVSLLQPNVPQDQKFDQALIDANLDRLAAQIESAQGQVVVTPESVAPLPLTYLDPAYIARLKRASLARPLLLGTFMGDEEHGFVNSLVAIDGSGGTQPYDYGKRHLLPFGEFVPTGFHWFVRLMGIPMEDQAYGQHQRAFAVAGQRLRPLICYEDLFGEDIVSSVVGPDAATVFVNASNLAWFGVLMVQDQHLQFSQMRALEFQRPVVRATNTGATAVVDYRGHITARLPAATVGVLESTVEGRMGSTPYARWLASYGLWPLWASAIGLLLGVLSVAFWRRRAS